MKPDETLLTSAQVLSITGFKSRSTIWRKVKKKEFPAPVKAGSCSIRWRSSEVRSWMQRLPRQEYARPNPRDPGDQGR